VTRTNKVTIAEKKKNLPKNKVLQLLGTNDDRRSFGAEKDFGNQKGET